VINLAITCLVIQSIFFILFYIARHLSKTLKAWECWIFIPLAYLCCTTLCICEILAVKIGGEGQHITVLNTDTITTRIKINIIAEYIDITAITSTKLAILILYYRIFSVWPKFQIAIYFTTLIVLGTWIGALVLSIVKCHPFSSQWDHTIKGGQCGDSIRAYQFLFIPNIITDCIMLVILCYAVYKLQVQLPTKISILTTLLTGSIGIITSVLRMLSFLNNTSLLNDFTYNSVSLTLFTIIEASTYFIAACMLSLRPFKRYIFKGKSF
ncbi:hypothetical protein BU16DRAFT_432973, partial [Lophium mytilinum]